MSRRSLLVPALLAALALAVPQAAADDVPFHDIGSVGGIALCDGQNHRLTGGSIDSQPFVYKAVSTVAAPSPYGGPGHSASLYAYQPRQDAYPDQWNGDSVTAASEYPDAQLDPPLATFLAAYPARWDNLVQMRLYWGARGVGFDGRHYATAVIKIEGHRWRLVSAPAGDCGTSTAVSTEVTIAHLNTTPTPSGSGHPTASRSALPGVATGPAGSSAAGSSGGTVGTAGSHAPHSASWSDLLPWLAGALAVLIGLGALVRRRSRAR